MAPTPSLRYRWPMTAVSAAPISREIAAEPVSLTSRSNENLGRQVAEVPVVVEDAALSRRVADVVSRGGPLQLPGVAPSQG